MIVTRRRRKPFPWRRVLIPVAIVVVVVAALEWAPSRNWIATGPLAPVWKPVSTPFDAVGEHGTIDTQNRRIASLQQQLAQAQAAVTARDKQISGLQTQLNSAQVDAARAKSAHAPATASASPNPAFGDLSANATANMRRTAADWSAMDAESAAKVVQRLPVPYVVRIFALMSPDAVGAILENLPPAYAAQLTQERPELRR